METAKSKCKYYQNCMDMTEYLIKLWSAVQIESGLNQNHIADNKWTFQGTNSNENLF